MSIAAHYSLLGPQYAWLVAHSVHLRAVHSKAMKRSAPVAPPVKRKHRKKQTAAAAPAAPPADGEGAKKRRRPVGKAHSRIRVGAREQLEITLGARDDTRSLVARIRRGTVIDLILEVCASTCYPSIRVV